MFQEKDNLRFHLGSLIQINQESKTIETDTGIITYDYLVIALGTETNYFGMERVKNNALPMKNITDALKMRNHILLSMECAVRSNDPVEKVKFLNVVIAGGGPSGVEIAGMLAELGRNIAAKEYPEIQNLKAFIHLVDSSPTLLGPMSRLAQQEAYDVLSKLGVQILLNTTVKDYDNGEVILGDGSTIATNTLIWTTGVIGRALPGIQPEVIGRGRRVMVDEFNAVKDTKAIYALGDIALQTTDENFPNGHPQLAQVAIQQGILLAKNFHKMAANQPLKPFKYNDKGSMAIIAKYKAVADLPKFSFKGFFAWLIWLFIHIIPIAGFRNKVKLALSWLWSFMTNNPTIRLIIRSRP
jgi:NADH dehydrogenase